MDSDELYDSLDEEIPYVNPTNSRVTVEGDHRDVTVIYDGTSKQLSTSDSEDVEPKDSSQEPLQKEEATPIRTIKIEKIEEQVLKSAEDDKKKAQLDITEAVPLYVGEMPKECLKKSRKTKSKQSSSMGNNKNLSKLNFKEQRTYSNIFNARKELLNHNSKAVTDTARANCGGDSARSKISEVSSHFSDAKSSVSDTTSFYMDLLKKPEVVPDISTVKSPKTIRKISLETPSTSDLRFKSVSQFFPSDCSYSESTKSSRKPKTRLSMTTPTVLGGLGPDLETIQEKLSLLKKRRSYGQKVSDRNRIKLQEMKVLRDLNEEIRKSRM